MSGTGKRRSERSRTLTRQLARRVPSFVLTEWVTPHNVTR
jgi:hypothetical protein